LARPEAPPGAPRNTGQAKDASHGSLMMIVKGMQGMIEKQKLPYVIKRERDGTGLGCSGLRWG
jgi:hypothetical protein